MNLLPDKQLVLDVPFRLSKHRKKELFMDSKVQETIGDVYCTTFINEMCVCFSTIKTSSFEESPKTFQDDIGDVFCPGKYCLKREKCESIGGYVTTPGSIYGCGKCGAWFFVHKVPFMLQETVKTTKTDKTRFFARKR